MDHLQSRGSRTLPLLCCGVAPFEAGGSVTARLRGITGATWATLASHPLADNRPSSPETAETPAPPTLTPAFSPSFKAALETTGYGVRLRLLFSLPPTIGDDPLPSMAFNPLSKVGVLLDPVGDLTSYLEVTCSGLGEPGGSVGRVTRGVVRRDPRWRCERLQSAIGQGDCGEALIELAIPLSSLGSIAPHTGWRANFYYHPAPDAPYRLWSPTHHPRINLPERFGFLAMEIP